MNPLSYVINLCRKPPKLAHPIPDRRIGVPPGSDQEEHIDQIEIPKIHKDIRANVILTDALQSNDFLRVLMDDERLQMVVEAMSPLKFDANQFIIQEGDVGSHLFVSSDGLFEVQRGGVTVKRFAAGEAFGELALLYDVHRIASVRTTTEAKVWALEREIFQKIMRLTSFRDREEKVRFLAGVPLLQELHSSVLLKISDLLVKEFFPAGSVIVRQGEEGDKFYIIRVGDVTVTKRVESTVVGQLVDISMGVLTKGCFFGELALIRNDVRQATVIAQAPGVECLALDRRSFVEYLGNFQELFKVYEMDSGPLRPLGTMYSEYSHIRQQQLVTIRGIGLGGFGRVDLVQYLTDRSVTFALKRIQKWNIQNKKQREHIYNEKNTMACCNSPFICRLYKTFKDRKYLYFLMEVCMGGDLWTVLYMSNEGLNDKTVQFFAACVTEAFDYLHSRGIIYRDLKLENVMLDYRGYAKLVDFGYAKRLLTAKTWTVLNTSYTAPEMILNTGHDRAVDFWSLGTFIFELLARRSPFGGATPLEMFHLILEGIQKVDFPAEISKNAQSIIKKLCRPHITQRLGYQKEGIDAIRNHKWFEKFDWSSLQHCTMSAPLFRPFSGPTDLSNFPVKLPEEDLPPDDLALWDLDF